MGKFKRGGKPGFKKDFGHKDFGRRSFDERGGDREMHRATCNDCGKACEVPFRPSGDRPVYCNDCFRKHNSEDSGRSYGDRGGRRSRFERKPEAPAHNNDQLEKISRKLDKIIDLLDSMNPKGKKESKKETPKTYTPIAKE